MAARDVAIRNRVAMAARAFKHSKPRVAMAARAFKHAKPRVAMAARIVMIKVYVYFVYIAMNLVHSTSFQKLFLTP